MQLNGNDLGIYEVEANITKHTLDRSFVTEKIIAASLVFERSFNLSIAYKSQLTSELDRVD